MSDVKNKESRRPIVNKTLYRENPDLTALESCNAMVWSFIFRTPLENKLIKIIGILKSLANISYLAKWGSSSP